MCLNVEETEYVLRELHEGICGSHATGSSFTLKALRNDYFGPTMKVDALDLVKGCDKCERHPHSKKTISGIGNFGGGMAFRPVGNRSS